MSDLGAVVRIKTMARSAMGSGDPTSPEAGQEMAAAYERLRGEAFALFQRAGWGDRDAFDRELPPLDPDRPRARATRAMAMAVGGHDAFQHLADGRRARVLLGQLAGWAEGHQEAFEIEARIKTTAEAKAKAAPARQPPGFAR
jgi:hypothetical protein